MAYVIGEKCLGERYAVCATVCPVECIHPIDHKGEQFMIIDPEVCISCGLCLPECPVGAIVASESEDPAYAQVNKDLTPAAKNNPAAPERAKNDPPKKPGNKLVN
jgi:ferredoxin